MGYMTTATNTKKYIHLEGKEIVVHIVDPDLDTDLIASGVLMAVSNTGILAIVAPEIVDLITGVPRSSAALFVDAAHVVWAFPVVDVEVLPA